METEHWRYIPGYEGVYAVSTHGRVFSMKKALVLRTRIKAGRYRYRASDQYLLVELCKGGKYKRPTIHSLVLLAFRGPRLPGQECRHLDGDCKNNRLENLVWGSYQENRADWHKHRKNIKLTPDMVKYIRGSTKSLRALAAELGCAKSTVQYARGVYWRHVD